MTLFCDGLSIVRLTVNSALRPGIAGLALLLRRSPGGRFLGLALLGFVLLTILPVRHTQYRYTIFPGYLLAIGAGVVLAALVSASSARARAMAVLLLLAAAGTRGFRALDLTWQMVRDARYPASAWLAEQSRPGDVLGYFGAAHQLPALPPGLRPVQLHGDSAESVFRAGRIRYVYVAPDYFADSLHLRSSFLPEELYHRLEDGTLGFRLVQRFETPPLRSGWLTHFPWVNPPVRVYEATP